MRITINQLKNLIKEEVNRLSENTGGDWYSKIMQACSQGEECDEAIGRLSEQELEQMHKDQIVALKKRVKVDKQIRAIFGSCQSYDDWVDALSGTQLEVENGKMYLSDAYGSPWEYVYDHATKSFKSSKSK